MKKLYKVLLAIIVLTTILALSAGVYISAYLPNVEVAPYITIEKTEARIERGRYLANHVTVCMDCHSTRDWTVFSAPLKGNLGGGGEMFGEDMGFPGTIYSPNITPNKLDYWTDGEVFRAITTGVDKSGKALFPVMPYHNYGQMDKEDIYSIIAYLRSLAPIESNIPKRELIFPVNLLVNTMPHSAIPTTIPPETQVIEYGAYLVNAAGCVHCHSKTEKGAIIEGTEFGGGMEFVQPNGVVRGPNITKHPTNGIGSWTKESFVKRFKHYVDSAYTPVQLKPTDWNTPMPWTMYAGMKVSDLEAIYEYLNSIDAKDNFVVKFEPKK